MLWNFNEAEPTKTWLLDPWLTDDMIYAHHRDINNKCHIKLYKMCKGMLCDVSVDDNNCPISMPFIFLIFFRYTSPRN